MGSWAGQSKVNVLFSYSISLSTCQLNNHILNEAEIWAPIKFERIDLSEKNTYNNKHQKRFWHWTVQRFICGIVLDCLTAMSMGNCSLLKQTYNIWYILIGLECRNAMWGLGNVENGQADPIETTTTKILSSFSKPGSQFCNSYCFVVM